MTNVLFLHCSRSGEAISKRVMTAKCRFAHNLFKKKRIDKQETERRREKKWIDLKNMPWIEVPTTISKRDSYVFTNCSPTYYVLRRITLDGLFDRSLDDLYFWCNHFFKSLHTTGDNWQSHFPHSSTDFSCKMKMKCDRDIKEDEMPSLC